MLARCFLKKKLKEAVIYIRDFQIFKGLLNISWKIIQLIISKCDQLFCCDVFFFYPSSAESSTVVLWVSRCSSSTTSSVTWYTHLKTGEKILFYLSSVFSEYIDRVKILNSITCWNGLCRNKRKKLSKLCWSSFGYVLVDCCQGAVQQS